MAGQAAVPPEPNPVQIPMIRESEIRMADVTYGVQIDGVVLKRTRKTSRPYTHAVIVRRTSEPNPYGWDVLGFSMSKENAQQMAHKDVQGWCRTASFSWSTPETLSGRPTDWRVVETVVLVKGKVVVPDLSSKED